jgi:hypothetical protein
VRILRITLAVILICLIAAALIRQPILRGLPYTATVRADAQTLRRHVTYLTSRVPARNADHPESLDQAAVYIETRFRESSRRVDVQPFTARKHTYRNVTAHFGPTVGAVLIVGAHYDAFGDLPGADDNASGTAGLLELARLLGAHPPKMPVLLVAYSTEEPPFFGSDQMGSAVHAASLLDRKTNVAGMICLEMIGYYADRQTWPNATYAALYPSSGHFIAVGGGWADRALVRRLKRGIQGAGGIDVCSFTGPRIALDASDQRNYWANGYPAAIVTDTAFLRNPNYHTPRDTAATLDYVKMARVVDGVFNAVSQS